MDLKKLVSAVIGAKHGWAVAEQFENTFDGEEFEEQNYNALGYIMTEINDLIRAELLDSYHQDELKDYYEELSEYLTN
jgi:hypothetical protein